MTMHVKDAGVWRTASPRVKDGGVWRTVQRGSVRDGGVWKTFFNNTTFYVTVSPTSVTETSQQVTITIGASYGFEGYVTYSIIGTVGWGTSDYNLSNPPYYPWLSVMNKPAGSIFLPLSAPQNYFILTTVLDSETEAIESFYVDVKEGYLNYIGANVATTFPTFVNVSNSTYCIWALYGRPEWC